MNKAKRIARIIFEMIGLKKIEFSPRTLQEALNRHENIQYLGLIGLPRTGTSILRTLLNESEDLFLSYEHITYPLFNIKNQKEYLKTYYEILRQSAHLKDLSDNSYSYKYSMYDNTYKFLGDKCIFSDSSRFQSKLLKVIKKEKNLKTLLLIRHPLDRILSVIKWVEKRNIKFTYTKTGISISEFDAFVKNECRRWVDFINFVEKLKYRENVLLIKYEEMVNEPKSTLSNIFYFLGDAHVETKINYLSSHLKVNNKSESLHLKESMYQKVEDFCNPYLKIYYPEN